MNLSGPPVGSHSVPIRPRTPGLPFHPSVLLIALGMLVHASGGVYAKRFTVAASLDTLVASPGQSITLDLVTRCATPPFNAFDLALHFDPTRLTNVALSPLSAQVGSLVSSACVNPPFHLFTATPDSLRCTVVILCSGVSVSGPGTIYRVRFTASATEAWTTARFGHSTKFFNGGPPVDTLDTRPIVIRIGNPPVLGVSSPPSPRQSVGLDPVTPNPSRRPSELTLSFRLPRADAVEASLLDPLGRRMASSERTRRDAGERRLVLRLPRLAPGRYTLVLRTGSGDVRTRPWVVLR